ncbi:GNAT family N-acetyltransferase [Dactylosporangium sp. AC04546]|uniref:GNAT family N-acetyltransferase n=1 Tax=Dactylosporangium sp. AC04546 TaxID=2862460 RepID=UPI001EDD5A41|nr:GNAT family N-acetyltransferase [Dactylosporangium sp. AC04546]WVK83292.1 GNAT family N-acetyltransferase [Dactylosporangium sp. AC04546]
MSAFPAISSANILAIVASPGQPSAGELHQRFEPHDGSHAGMTIEIRPVTEADLDAIDPRLGSATFFAERRARQRDERGLLLLAWLSGNAVGCVYIAFEEADEAGLREHLPGVPLMHRLLVVSELRNQGIGSSLVTAAEQAVRARGHAQLALGMDIDNFAAERLYLRLGYHQWLHGLLDTYYIVIENGQEVHVPEQCRVLVKTL